MEVTVRTKYCSSNKEAVGKYEGIINKQYKELEDGKFEDVTKEILETCNLTVTQMKMRQSPRYRFTIVKNSQE